MALYPHATFSYMGDRGLLLEFGDEIHPAINRKVRRLALALKAEGLAGIIELVPTYRSLLILYAPLIISVETLKEKVKELEEGLEQIPLPETKRTRIPVLYGGTSGPDLDFVARHQGISAERVIELHCRQPYLIYMIGFMPGYPYMGEVPPELVTPRLETPRISVPAGSVGIAQKQTGIYPMESPGGWQIIGRTPVKLFDPEKTPPSLLCMGDLVQFYPIHENEFECWTVQPIVH